MKLVISIAGGVGKQIMFTAMLPSLSTLYDEIHIQSPYDLVFQNNPYVTSLNEDFSQTSYKKMLRKDDTRIVIQDPYDQESFIKKKEHLLNTWWRLCTSIELEPGQISETPELYLSSSELNKCDALIDNIKGKDDKPYMLVQFSGGQSPLSYDDGSTGDSFDYINDPIQRALPPKYMEKLVLELRKRFPDHTLLRYGLPNEYVPRKIDDEIAVLSPPVSYNLYKRLAEEADAIVCIDSSLQHIAAAAHKKATVIWSGTSPDHFGWNIHTNLREEQKDDDYPYFRLTGQIQDVIFPHVQDVLDCIKI